MALFWVLKVLYIWKVRISSTTIIVQHHLDDDAMAAILCQNAKERAMKPISIYGNN